jgi:UDP-glucose 4-epimerase
MKILLTGGIGFIASHIAQTYLENNHQVFIIDKNPKSKLPACLKGQVKYFHFNLTKSGFEDIIHKMKPDIVNHHAALISVSQSQKHPTKYANNNVLSTYKLLELSQKYQVKQFIFASSVAVYGDTKNLPIKENTPLNPKSFYGLNKLSCEYAIKLFQNKFKTVIFRYSNVYGPRQDSSAEGGVVAIFARNLINQTTSTIYGNGNQTRDFIYVKDVAQANLLAIKNQSSGIFNISSNQETSINNLYQIMQKIAQSNSKANYQEGRLGDIYRSYLDNTKAKNLLKWQPEYSLEKGLKETIDYFKNVKT